MVAAPPQPDGGVSSGDASPGATLVFLGVRLLEEDLKRQGYEVEIVGEGEAAIRRASREAWDLILLDSHATAAGRFRGLPRVAAVAGEDAHHPTHG
jgi:DNA-binding NtrC family response regulator